MNNIIYPKRTDAKRYIMGAVCVVEEVVYNFNVINPMVTMYARNSQTFVVASGISITNPPGPPVVPVVPTDPNVPPNGGGGNLTHGIFGGDDWLMPEIVEPDPVSFDIIEDTTTQMQEFTITVDDGWLFNKGWSFDVYISLDGGTEVSGSSLAENGAELGGQTSGVFPDKENDIYVPPVFTVELSVNYYFFNDQGEETRDKNLQMVLHKRWIEGDTPCEEFVMLEPVSVRRKDITEVEGA